MKKETIEALLKKIESGAASEEELGQYNRLYTHDQNDETWDERRMGNKQKIGQLMYKKITEAMASPLKRNHDYQLYRYAAAAAVIIGILTGLYYYNFKKETLAPTQTARTETADIAPGGNKATLTLANGTKISLTDAANGNLLKQSGVSITKTAEGQLVYTVTGDAVNRDNPVEFNTIVTPKGGQYQILLPDGSKVWLNSLSSLRFPTAFSTNERRVELTGEAYFEVSKDKRKPFSVSANGTEVAVLGTHFNVMAYQDEAAVKTTLLEGSVKLFRAGATSLLKPGEQGISEGNGKGFLIEQADVSEVMAWKNGYFIFKNAGLPEVMRQISRWYNVEVIYPEKLKDHEFIGEISRSYSLMKILKILETSEVTFKLEGNTLTIK